MLTFLKKLYRRLQAEPAELAASLRSAVAGKERAERGLRHSEQHFEELVAGVSDYAICLLDPGGRVATWNAGAERIKGYRAAEIVGEHFSRFYTREDLAADKPGRELSIARASGRLAEEGWRVRKDGSQFWASVALTVLRHHNGETRGFLKITRDLSERKEAEEALRVSDERFRLIVEGVQDYAIFMLDPKGHVVTWNVGAERLKGYKAEEIVGAHFSRFYPPGDVERGWPSEELRRAEAGGRFEDEGWRVRKDGSLFWANVVITALRDRSGALQGFAKVTRDLTLRREMEEKERQLAREEAARHAAQEAAREIERQREQLRITLASIGDAVVATDSNGDVTFLNPVAETLTGWTQREAAGQPLERIMPIVHEQTRETVENPVRRVFREKSIVTLANHTALVTHDGREVPIEDSASPIRDKNDEIEGAVLVFRDVSDVRKARDARLRLAAIVDSSDDAIIGKSLDGIVGSWNKGAERLYGYTAEEMVGKPLSILVPRDQLDELPGIMERVRRGEGIEHFETNRLRKDGTIVPVSLTISPIKNAAGKVIGASKIARDISDRKRVEEALREEDRRKTEFIALLAHELRNPLAPLRNSIHVLRLAGGDRLKVGQVLPVMERQLQYLVRLVDDLLEISRISGGKLELRKERVLLADVVNQALETCEAVVKEEDDELIVTLPDEPLYVDADKTRLAQVLCNLVTNSAKYSESHSRIWLTVKREGDHAIISVKDRGIGIPAEMLPKIFDLFAQVDRSIEKSRGGLGIGLAIVKQLVELHGGSVEAYSEGQGKGAEFIVRIPAVLSRVFKPVRGAEERIRPSAKRILVVDDNADSVSSMEMMLKMMGSEVRSARDGVGAVEMAAAFRPDIILMDIGMPVLNGYDACRLIREQPWEKQPFIVALTGWGQDADKKASEEAGFDAHLVKPVEPATLEKLVAER